MRESLTLSKKDTDDDEERTEQRIMFALNKNEINI